MHGLGAGFKSQLPLMQQTSMLKWDKFQTHHKRQMTKKGLDRNLTPKTPPNFDT